LNQGTLTVGTGGTLGATTGALSVNNTNSTAAGTAAILNLSTALDTTVGTLSGTIATPTSGTNTATINTQTGRNFTVNQTAAASFAGEIAGAGNFTLGSTSNNVLTLSGTNTYAGTTQVDGGTLVFGKTSAKAAGTVTAAAAGTVGLGIGGAGYYSAANVGDLFNTNTLSGFSLASASGVAIDTTNAAGGSFDQDVALTAARALTKLGSGTLVLSQENSYTGLTTVNAGVLQVANNNGLGGTAAGTVVNGTNNGFVGTVLDLNGVSISSGESLTMASGGTASARVSLRTVGTTTNTWAGGVSLTGSRAVQFFANTGGQLEISGAITHSAFTGTVSIRGAGTGILSGGVTLSGTTDITVNDGGTWNVNTIGNTWGNTNAYRGTLVLGANDALPTTTSLNLGGDANSGTLKLNGKSQTVAGLTTTGTGTTNKIVGGNATAGALTVNNSTANSFSGVLGGTGTDENNFSLTKSGEGELTLSGASTYTGATLISGGTLVMGDAVTDTFSTAAVTVASDAKLAGAGTIAGTAVVTGILAPGIAGVSGGIGTLAAGETTWNGAATSNAATIWQFDLSANSNASDALAIIGDFKKDSSAGTVYEFNFMNSAPTTWGNVYTLVTWTGTSQFTSASEFTWSNLGGAYDLQPGTGFTLNANSLTFTAVPEPTSALAGLLVAAGLLRRRRHA
jgi:autotransporter-associated beta strand protein